MASDQSTERIIDLIYGELPEEEEEQMRKELADSAELRAELDSYEDFLGELRSAVPTEEPSPSVHASIMDAARAAAENGSERRDARRAPGSAESMGVWGRLSSSSIAQFATVAAVLLAGVFVVRFVEQGSDPTMAPASDISAAREPAPPMAAMEKAEDAPAELEVAEEEVAEADTAAAAADGQLKDTLEEGGMVGGEDEVIAQATAEPADEPEADLFRSERAQKRAAGAADKRELRRDQPAEEPTRRRARSAKKEAAKPKPVETKSRAKAKEKTVALDTLEKSLDTDSFDDSGFAASAEQQESAPRGRGADLAEPKPSAAPPQQQEAREYRAEAGTISAVEEQWRSRDYGGTVRAADEFLQSGQGSNTDKARAMHLKAQAYMEQGRYSQAERLFATIQKNYPSYMTSQINQGRAEAKSKLEKKPRRKSRSRPSKKADEAVESYDAPSSLDY